MRKGLLLVLVLFLALTVGAFAFQNEPDGFRGLKWGDPVGEEMEYLDDLGGSDAKGREIEEGNMLLVGLIAPIISAGCALLAVWMAHRTRRFMRRTERPIISLFNGHATLKDFTICLKFKNTGKHPATKVKVHMLGCYNQDPLKPKKIGKKGVHITNRKDPGMSFSCKKKIPYEKIEDLFFYINITYQDEYTAEDYCDDFKLIYKKGKSSLQDMDIADWNRMKEKIPRKFLRDSKRKNYLSFLKRPFGH